MSVVLDLDAARARGIALPADDTQAQAILDETEAILARELRGPLIGERTETFYVGGAGGLSKLALSRYTDAVTIEDNGHAVASDQFRLLDSGSAIARDYSASSWWWTGPYVAVTYEPNDLLELTSVAYQLLSLSSSPAVAAGDLQSETIGSYQYTRGASSTTPQGALASRRAIIAPLKPKRDKLANVTPTALDYPTTRDYGRTGVINQAELPT